MTLPFFVNGCPLPAAGANRARPCVARLPAIVRILLLTVIPISIQLSMARLAVAADDPAPVVVEIDRATLIKLPVGRQRVLIVDDPLIVRATFMPAINQVVVTGLSFGQTRMSVLSEAGEVLATSMVLVKRPAATAVTVYRGDERGTYYDCARQCQPGLQLGDNGHQFADIAEQIRNGGGKETPQPRMDSGGHL